MNELKAKKKAFKMKNPSVNFDDKSGKPQLIAKNDRITVWCHIHGQMRKIISITRHHKNGEWTKPNGEWWIDHSEIDKGLVTLYDFVLIQECFRVAMEALNEKLKEERESNE